MTRCSMREAIVTAAICALLGRARATFVVVGDSFSDDGRGANVVVQGSLSQDSVRFESIVAAASSRIYA